MATNHQVLLKAAFNPRIKDYILISGVLMMLISMLGIPLLFCWLLGVGKWISSKYYNSLQCELTTRHLRFKKGAFNKVEKTIPLENIQDLTFIDNPILRWFDLRMLKIETAGSSNPHGSDMKLIGIMDTENFKEQVLEQREVLISRKKGDDIPSSAVSSSLDTQLLTEIRDLLKDIARSK